MALLARTIQSLPQALVIQYNNDIQLATLLKYSPSKPMLIIFIKLNIQRQRHQYFLKIEDSLDCLFQVWFRKDLMIFISKIKLFNRVQSNTEMPKQTLTAYKFNKQERSNSIQSHKYGAVKIRAKNIETSTKANTSKHKPNLMSPPKPHRNKSASSRKDPTKNSSPNRKHPSRDGFTMTNSVNIPHLSPVSHSEFTRNNSLQFTTHFGDQSINIHPLSQILQRTQMTLERYQRTTQRLTSRNKEISRKLAQANHQITLLEKQIRKSKQL